MKLPNPNEGKPFEHVAKGKQGQDEYGFRTIDGIEEIVHIPSGKSNMTYYQPEKVTHYEDCVHVFRVIDIGNREIECVNPLCRLLTAFHPAINYREEEGKGYVRLNKTEYRIEF